MTVSRILLSVAPAVALAGCESARRAESSHLGDTCRNLPPCAELLGPGEAATDHAMSPSRKKHADRMVRRIRRSWEVPLSAGNGCRGQVRVRL